MSIVSNRDLDRSKPLVRRLSSRARTTALTVVASMQRQTLADDAIHFPFYHWVLDDERAGFERQLRELKRLGDPVSLDDAIEMLTGDEPIRGRYFCITFDDGFRNNLTNATPILVEQQIPAAFFLPTDLIGLDLIDDRDMIERVLNGGGGIGNREWRMENRACGMAASPSSIPHSPFPIEPPPFDYLNWDECRQMRDAGMTLGSHTCGHLRLTDLDDTAAERELAESKSVIERELGTSCDHFAAPFGQPLRDFDPLRDPLIAQRLGYKSFLTTTKGANGSWSNVKCEESGERRAESGSNSALRSRLIRRNDVVASHGPLLFRYLMGRG